MSLLGIMKKVISIFLILFGLLFSSNVFAFDIEGSVEVPKNCEVIDTSGKLHSFPKENSPEGFLGVCAIVAAKTAGIINEFSFIDFGFGLFLDSINGVKTSSDWDLSWSLYKNGELASVGLADLVLQEGDVISLIYTSYSSGTEFDKLVLNISLASSSSSNNRVSAGVAVSRNPNVGKLIQFLISKQDPEGLIENPLFTDWTALAFSSYFSVYNPEHPNFISLKNYFLRNTDPGPSLGSPILSFIRRAMALMALGINPYSGTPVNYVQKIINSFDGNQVGDPELVNDDIFALLVLRKAGFDSTDEIVTATTKFILENQKPDGSFAGGVDMTAAAIQSLSLVSGVEGVSQALSKARTYLQSQQQEDGGFGNPDSTSWAMQAIVALGEDWRDWKKNNRAPGEYLLLLQKQDGSLDSPLPVWSSAFAVPAVYGKSWGMILNSFSKEEKKANLNPEELERISKELVSIHEKALVLQEKISLLSLEETKNIVQQKEKEKEHVVAQPQKGLREEENQTKSDFQKKNNLTKILKAQIGVYTDEFLPYVVVVTIIFAVVLLLVITKLWKTSIDKK